MVGEAGRRAAWDAYLAVTERLLPALRRGDSDEVINPLLGGVMIRIRRYAPLWKHSGPMLIAACSSAVRLLRDGDRAALTGLAAAITRRLFLLSAGPARLHHSVPRHAKTAGHKRFEPGTNRPGIGQRRTTRHREQHHEKGSSDD
jgi:hypothetical protein